MALLASFPLAFSPGSFFGDEPASGNNIETVSVDALTGQNTGSEKNALELLQNAFAAKSRNLSRPNIVLIVPDALNPLDMQGYDYVRPTTPFLSEWANDAIVFNSVYSQSNWTTPSMMSVMTSQRPWKHKVWYRVKYHAADRYADNLPSLLKDNGYNVYGFV